MSMLSISRLSVVLLLSMLVQDMLGQRGGRRFGPPGMMSPLMELLDADGSGDLDAMEILDAAAAVAGMDRNGDGNVTQAEIMPDFGGDRRGRRMRTRGMMRMMDPVLRALDLDGDGELFEDEVTDVGINLLALDKDRNGVVSDEELRPPRDSFGGMRGRGGFRRGRGESPSEPLMPEDLEPKDGAATIPDRATFEALSYQGEEVMIDTQLKGLEFVKFTIVDAGADSVRIYFLNTQTHRAHPMFGQVIGVPRRGFRGEVGDMYGVLVYRPMASGLTGGAGHYTFEFEPNDAYDYRRIRIAYDLLTSKAPLLKGNLSYYPLPAAMRQYESDRELYGKGNLPVYLPDDSTLDIAFLPLNKAVGFGTLRALQPGERPGPRDVVLLDALPNEMPRVAGVLSAARQTPLSHVNLRAVQDRIPNAFIKDAHKDASVTKLLGKYVRYEVNSQGYRLEEVDRAAVDKHFEALRPDAEQTPPHDLKVKNIRPLSEIRFRDSTSVGAKAANLAELHRLGFPEGVVPDGFAVPFFFYDQFMKANGLYEAAGRLMADPEFQSDAVARQSGLAAFRMRILKAKMPVELAEQLEAIAKRFDPAWGIRCRSSTNNEDLPGFSGAGLYDSVTHRKDEGPLANSIKQVYASLWNYRAFEERAFHRISHLKAAMGVLLHHNYHDEQVNGVAVTRDTVYQSDRQGELFYYVNSQVGEDLITNPTGRATPEELLLAPRNPAKDRLLQSSSASEQGRSMMAAEHLLQLRRSLRVIDRAFRKFYKPKEDAPFAMEIEFKITKDNKLAVKQARPWVF